MKKSIITNLLFKPVGHIKAFFYVPRNLACLSFAVPNLERWFKHFPERQPPPAVYKGDQT